MRLNQQNEPHPFIHMNPLFRNPGTAPSMPIMDGRPGWNGWTHGRMGGCASYLVGVRSFSVRIFIYVHILCTRLRIKILSVVCTKYECTKMGFPESLFL